MTEPEDMGSYDAIIVGAGMGGLVAGNALLLQGHSVLMVEQHVAPGGYTTNFERKEFRFDVSTHLLNGCGPGGVIDQELRKIDASGRAEFIEVETLMTWRDLEREVELLLPVALSDHVEKLVELFPEEERGIRDFYHKYGRMAEFLFASSNVSESELPAMMEKYPSAMQDLLALKERTAGELLNEYVSNPELQDLMTVLTGFFGLCKEELDAFTFIVGDLSYRLAGEGAFYPKGGSGHFAKVLADLFEERGGKLLLNRKVTQLSFSDGLVDGIVARSRRGRQFRAGCRTLIANSDVTALVSELTPPGTFPSEYVEQIEKRIPCCSAVVMYVGLDIDLRAHGVTGYEIHATWGEEVTPELIHEVSRTADYSRLPIGNATVYSNVDPTCCPEGKSLLSCIYFADPEVFEQTLDDGGKRGKAYKALKQRIISQLLEKLGRTLGIADLESHIEVVELGTPITLKRYTSNRNGSFVGWRYTPDQGSFNNIPQESPVPNLFLCGQWIAPGGGVAAVMMGGNAAAELVNGYLGNGKESPAPA